MNIFMWFLVLIFSAGALLLVTNVAKNWTPACNVILLLLLFCNAAGLLLLQGMEYYSCLFVFAIIYLYLVLNYYSVFRHLMTDVIRFLIIILKYYIKVILILYRELALKRPLILLSMSFIAHTCIIYFNIVLPVLLLYLVYFDWLSIQLLLVFFGKGWLLKLGFSADFLSSCGINSGFRAFLKSTMLVLGGASLVLYEDYHKIEVQKHAAEAVVKLDSNVIEKLGELPPEISKQNREYALETQKASRSVVGKFIDSWYHNG